MNRTDRGKRLLQLAGQGLLRGAFLKEASLQFAQLAAADTVEIRARDKDISYRWQSDNQGDGNLQPVVFIDDPALGQVPFIDEDSGLEQVCREAFIPRSTPELHFTSGPRTVYLADCTQTISLSHKKKVINLAAETGFSSMLILPFCTQDESWGLVIIKAVKRNFLQPGQKEEYEDLIRSLAVATDMRRSQAALKERIKELTCLYEIHQLFQAGDENTDELLQQVTMTIPPAFQYPALTQCRIVHGKKVYKTANFNLLANRLTAPLFIHGKKAGRIEVVYDNGPLLGEPARFLVEEQRLLELICQKVSMMLESRLAVHERQRIEEQLRHADRLATIGQLAAGFAHELNNPLANILGFAQLLIKQFPSGGVNEDLQRIVRSSLQARETVRKLLLFGRQLPTNLTMVDFNQLITETLDLLSSRLEKNNIQTVLMLSSDLPVAEADTSQMTQVVMNLVVNALQAMPQGGVLTIGSRISGKSVGLTVEDTGQGMTEVVRKQIFIPFFTTKKIGEGTGLGLCVVHGIVTAHKGSIRVTSQPGKGSRFTVSLPLRQSEK